MPQYASAATPAAAVCPPWAWVAWGVLGGGRSLQLNLDLP
jgi:hypothetical protein